ncbi:MAG TPA: ATP-grasp domain-containing protein, partial [Candidatus Paceibacterota bacterium]|nr:ATP-grasp domain-containing protein [Candidatus Paceibacterota bacterium]
ERGKASSPDRILPTVDVAVVALHGAYGQDGEVQKLLERFGVAYTGADPWACYLSAHKLMAKKHVEEVGLLTPRYHFIDQVTEIDRIVHEAIRTFHQPVVVKPVDSGSSVGVSIVGGYAPVHLAVTNLFLAGTKGVLIEELVKGTEATVGIVEGLRGEELYALPPVEIVPSAAFFSYEAKYSGQSREICPGRFDRRVSEALMDAARRAHEALGLRHYSRSDFIVSPKGIYYLETNNAAAVGMTGESLFPKSLAAVGVGLPEFLEHLIERAKRH